LVTMTETLYLQEAWMLLTKPIVLRTTHGIAAEANRRNFRVCMNSHSYDHVAHDGYSRRGNFSGSVVRGVQWLNDTSNSKSKLV